MVKGSVLIKNFLIDYNKFGDRVRKCEALPKREELKKKQRAVYAKVMCLERTMKFFGDIDFGDERIPFKAREFIDYVEAKVFKK